MKEVETVKPEIQSKPHLVSLVKTKIERKGKKTSKRRGRPGGRGQAWLEKQERRIRTDGTLTCIQEASLEKSLTRKPKESRRGRGSRGSNSMVDVIKNKERIQIGIELSRRGRESVGSLKTPTYTLR